MQDIAVWIGRDNVDVFTLLQDGLAVEEESVTKVQIRFGSFCISSDDAEPLVSVDSEGVVTAQLGRIADLVPGNYRGHIVVYDALATEGIMWQQIHVTVRNADVCD